MRRPAEEVPAMAAIAADLGCRRVLGKARRGGIEYPRLSFVRDAHLRLPSLAITVGRRGPGTALDRLSPDRVRVRVKSW
jgi:hypothetical protein